MEVDVRIASLGEQEFLVIGKHWINLEYITNISIADDAMAEVELQSDTTINLTEEATAALYAFLEEKTTHVF